MRDFKKLFKIIWKRFGLWVILLSLFTAMIGSLNVQDKVKYDVVTLRESVEKMAEDTNISIDTSRIDNEFLDEADKVAKAYVDKYEIIATSSIDIKDEEKYNRYYEKMSEKYGRPFYEIEDPIAMYAYIRNLLISKPLDFYDTEMTEESYPDSYAIEFVRSSIIPILLLVGLISFLITSLEQSLPSYEFTMMYPWRKRDEVWMKSILSFIFGIITLAIVLLVGGGVLKSSALGSAISFAGITSHVLNHIIIILATSILSVATGMIAGNLIGHFGMFIIAGSGVTIIRYIIYVFLEIFNNGSGKSFDRAFSNFEMSLPRFLKPFITIFNTSGELPEDLGYLTLAIIWAVIAYVINNKINAEKSGYLVISKPFEVIAKVLGTLATTSILYMILNSSLLNSQSIVINIICYVLSLLLSYKLFDILFKVRLKF